jgi:glucosamine kinase
MNQIKQYYIGIDGGGTACRARITDDSNTSLGEATAGSANVFQNHQLAWQSVQSCVNEAANQAGLTQTDIANAIVVAGLAGAEVTSCADQFKALVQGFKEFHLLNDAQTACLGAHSGKNGAIYIVGTGSIGIAYDSGAWRRVGGWGFPLDDIGSGAWLGQQAIRTALKQLDGMTPKSAMTEKVWQQFNHQADKLITWSQTASSGQYGQFAPLVTEAFSDDDPEANSIIQTQINQISEQIKTLVTSEMPLSLMGGLAQWLTPHLPAEIQNQLTPSQGDALSGALLYAQKRNEL